MTNLEQTIRDQVALEYCNDSEKEFIYLFKAGWNAARANSRADETSALARDRDKLLCENDELQMIIEKLQKDLANESAIVETLSEEIEELQELL